MSDEMEKIIVEKSNEIKTKTLEELRRVLASAKGDLDAYGRHLLECTKIVLPVNVLDILGNGGEVVSGIVEVGSGDRTLRAGNELHIVYGSEYFFHPHSSRTPHRSPIILQQGKYRITVIVEKLEVEKLDV